MSNTPESDGTLVSKRNANDNIRFSERMEFFAEDIRYLVKVFRCNEYRKPISGILQEKHLQKPYHCEVLEAKVCSNFVSSH